MASLYNMGTGLDLTTKEYEGIMYFDQDNLRCGVGLSNPLYPLDVSGDVRCSGLLHVSNGISVNNNSMTITQAGFIGIGTSNPAYLLDVVGDSYTRSNLRAGTVTTWTVSALSNVSTSNLNVSSTISTNVLNCSNLSCSNQINTTFLNCSNLSLSNGLTCHHINANTNWDSFVSTNFLYSQNQNCLNYGVSNLVVANNFGCTASNPTFTCCNLTVNGMMTLSNSLNAGNSNGITHTLGNLTIGQCNLNVGGSMSLSNSFTASNSNVIHQLGGLTVSPSNVFMSGTSNYLMNFGGFGFFNDVRFRNTLSQWVGSDPYGSGTVTTIMGSDSKIDYALLKNVPAISSADAATAAAGLGVGLLGAFAGLGGLFWTYKTSTGVVGVEDVLIPNPLDPRHAQIGNELLRDLNDLFRMGRSSAATNVPGTNLRTNPAYASIATADF